MEMCSWGQSCFPQQSWPARGSEGSISSTGLCVEGRALQDTTTSLVRRVDVLVGEAYGCYRDMLAFQLMSPVQEKPDLCPSHTMCVRWGSCAR